MQLAIHRQLLNFYLFLNFITEVDVLVNVPRRIECVSCYFDFNTKKNTFPLFLFCYNNTVNFLLISDYIKLNFISRIIINSYSKATI